MKGGKAGDMKCFERPRTIAAMKLAIAELRRASACIVSKIHAMDGE